MFQVKCQFDGRAVIYTYRGADNSLARPGRKQVTATKLPRPLTCFLSASVTRKYLQFVT